MNIQKGAETSGQPGLVIVLKKNRHPARWRFVLLTISVIVYLPICNVSVIGMRLTPFAEVWLTACRYTAPWCLCTRARITYNLIKSKLPRGPRLMERIHRTRA